MRRGLIVGLMLWALPVWAAPIDDVAIAAGMAFDQMPGLQRVPRIAGHCGSDDSVNGHVAYCTSDNVIYVTDTAADLPQGAYLVAHAYGHAVQVRHGVADVALAQIRARRAEEPVLRNAVERQVDCIAGFLVARAGLAPARLSDWMTDDPFAGAHWGRNPLRIGPAVSVDLDARDDWFGRGQGGDLTACATAEFGADLLIAALRR